MIEALLSLMFSAVPLPEMVQRFDDPAWTVRRDATREVAADWETYPLEEIEAHLRRADLSHEQRSRLIHAVDVRLLTLPRGALGIQMQDFGRVPVAKVGPDSGTMIIRLIRGMPAEQLLKEGDVVTAIEGEPVLDRSDLVRLVQRRWPGEVIDMVVQRPPPDGEGVWTTHEFQIALGSVADLPGRVAASDRQDDVRYVAGLRRLHGIQPIPLSGPASEDVIGTQFDWMLEAIRSQRRSLDEGTAGAPRAMIERMWGDWIEVTEAALGDAALDPQDRARLERLVELLRLETHEGSDQQGDDPGDQNEQNQPEGDPQRH